VGTVSYAHALAVQVGPCRQHRWRICGARRDRHQPPGKEGSVLCGVKGGAECGGVAGSACRRVAAVGDRFCGSAAQGAFGACNLQWEASQPGGWPRTPPRVVMLTYDRPILTCAHNRRKQGDRAESAPCGWDWWAGVTR